MLAHMSHKASVSVLQNSDTWALFTKNRVIQYKSPFNAEKSDKIMHLLNSSYMSEAVFSTCCLPQNQTSLEPMSVMER